MVVSFPAYLSILYNKKKLELYSIKGGCVKTSLLTSRNMNYCNGLFILANVVLYFDTFTVLDKIDMALLDLVIGPLHTTT